MSQVEGEAKSLKKMTEALEGRTQALTDQLAKQRAEYAQKLFEAQQEVNQVRLNNLLFVVLWSLNTVC